MSQNDTDTWKSIAISSGIIALIFGMLIGIPTYLYFASQTDEVKQQQALDQALYESERQLSKERNAFIKSVSNEYDCPKLTNTINDLISDGANSQCWRGWNCNADDRQLQMAEEKHGYLCEVTAP